MLKYCLHLSIVRSKKWRQRSFNFSDMLKSANTQVCHITFVIFISPFFDRSTHTSFVIETATQIFTTRRLIPKSGHIEANAIKIKPPALRSTDGLLNMVTKRKKDPAVVYIVRKMERSSCGARNSPHSLAFERNLIKIW